MSDIAVVVPTFNERANLTSLVQEILSLGLGATVIIVDDNSPDGTGLVADQLAMANSSVHVIHRPAKLGLGTAHIAGFRQALTMEAHLICTMDADFSHRPLYLPQMVALAQECCDVVIGSRYVPGGGTQHCTLSRRILSRGANIFAKTALGLHVQDCTAGFRCYRADVLQNIELGEIFSDGYSFLVELLYKCHCKGYRIGEIPIVFENRTKGQSKISRMEISKAVLTVLRLNFMRLAG